MARYKVILQNEEKSEVIKTVKNRAIARHYVKTMASDKVKVIIKDSKNFDNVIYNS